MSSKFYWLPIFTPESLEIIERKRRGSPIKVSGTQSLWDVVTYVANNNGQQRLFNLNFFEAESTLRTSLLCFENRKRGQRRFWKLIGGPFIGNILGLAPC